MKGKKPIFSYKDTWSLDSVLDPIIAAGLHKFKEVVVSENRGYPAIFEMSDEQKAMFDDEDYCDKISMNEWIRVLDRMIYAFEAPEPEIPDVLEHKFGEPREDGLIPMEIIVTNPEAHAKYKWLSEDHERKVVEGRELFSKYYNYLWW